MKRFSILIYCVDTVGMDSFGQTFNTTQKEGYFELSLCERDDRVVNTPSLSLVYIYVIVRRSGRRRNVLLLSLGAF